MIFRLDEKISNVYIWCMLDTTTTATPDEAADLIAPRRRRCQLNHRAPDVWPTLRYDGELHIDAEGDEPAYTLEQRTCTACRSSFTRPLTPTDLAAPFRLVPTAADFWSWIFRDDLTTALTRYVEVTHDRGVTVVCLDENGAQHWSGAEIDWLDVIERDVNGRRLHERVGADGERSAA